LDFRHAGSNLIANAVALNVARARLSLSRGCAVMSMIGHVCLVAASELEDVLATPEKIHALVARDFENEDCVNLGKNWHCPHFLVSGTNWTPAPVLDFIAVGGEAIGQAEGALRARRRTRPRAVGLDILGSGRCAFPDC
jgi:hypothetical protein